MFPRSIGLREHVAVGAVPVELAVALFYPLAIAIISVSH